jgi:hypothetical protein
MTEESIEESFIADSVDKSDGHQLLTVTLNNRNGTLDRGLNTHKRVCLFLNRQMRDASRSLLLE